MTFTCSVLVSSDCCTALTGHGTWDGSIDAFGTKSCDEMDTYNVDHVRECVPGAPSCKNDEDRARFSDSCTEDITQSTVDCDQPPRYDCVKDNFLKHYSEKCSTTLADMIKCGANHAMPCIISHCSGGLGSDECQKCLQDQMIEHCVPSFEAASGINACPSRDFPDAFWTTIFNAGNALQAYVFGTSPQTLYEIGRIVKPDVAFSLNSIVGGCMGCLALGLFVAVCRRSARAETQLLPEDWESE